MVRGFALAVMAATSAWLGAVPATAQTCAAPGAGTTACGGNCAQILIPDANGERNQSVDIPINFAQAPDTGGAGQGPDDISAITFTVGVPGTGEGAPLTFECVDGNLAPNAVTIGSSLADDFTVVVENAQCTGRTHCLCPGEGQTRDNFVNIAIYGPRNLPEQGPVQIPILPDTANPLVTLRMQVADSAPDTVPVTVFSSVTGTPAKPQFGANLSVGDQTACDVTANGANMNVGFDNGQVNVGGGNGGCVGDCNGNNVVAINELVLGVNIALGSQNVSVCLAFDANDSGTVTINELVLGVNNALGSCPS